MNNQAVLLLNDTSILQKRKRARAVCIAAVVAVLIATLSPFNPFPRNGVTWLPATGGLKFEGTGLVMSGGPLRPAETQATESYSLELMLRPATTKFKSTILGFYNPARPTQLLVRQFEGSLHVTHDRTIQSDTTQTIDFEVDHFFFPGRLVLLTISSGPNGTAVYRNGQPAGFFPRFRLSRSELSGQMVLGSSPVNYALWHGELHGLAVYSKELTPADALQHYQQWTDSSVPPDLDRAIARYTFAEGRGQEVGNQVAAGPSLEIPASFSVPHKGFLRSPPKEFEPNRRYAIDVLENIAGFVPLGFIVCAYLAFTRHRWQAVLLTTVACGMLSFVIEVLQYYVPRRGSGMTDIITNTLGAALGAALAQASPGRHILERLKLIRRTQSTN